MTRRIFSLFLTMMLLCGLAISVSAHEVPDYTKKGSISVKMQYEGDPVTSGELTLYRVGAVREDNGNYSFVPTSEFSGCVTAFDDISSPALAKQLADYAKTDWKITTIAADKDGMIQFSDLELGLYLVVQTKAADGYEPIAPFLVAVPNNRDGKYIYDIDAVGKMDSLAKETQASKPTEPPKPSDDKLPQTGQRNWPVPLFAVGGMFLFVLGYYLRSGKEKGVEQ